jgi:hypothetical protein
MPKVIIHLILCLKTNKFAQLKGYHSKSMIALNWAIYASEILQKVVGKSLVELWIEQGIDKNLERHHNSAHLKEEYEVFIEQLGIMLLSNAIPV